MPARRAVFPLLAAALAWLTACGRAEPAGPVRTPAEASEVARRALRSAGLDEEVVDVERRGRAWIVITRWRETSVAGHLVMVDAQTGSVEVERYRTLELGGGR